MSHFFSEWQLIIRRSLANWRLLSAIIVGVLIAVTLIPGGKIRDYSRR